MPRGGKREGAGRKHGSLSKKTREIAEAIAEGKTPLEFLNARIWDDGLEMRLRIQCAAAAAPYCHPRLNAIEHTGIDGGPLKVILSGPDSEL